jgi:hypothetical protein
VRRTFKSCSTAALRKVYNNGKDYNLLKVIMQIGIFLMCPKSGHKISGISALGDQTGDFSNGGCLAHRNSKERKDEPETLRATRRHYSVNDSIVQLPASAACGRHAAWRADYRPMA